MSALANWLMNCLRYIEQLKSLFENFVIIMVSGLEFVSVDFTVLHDLCQKKSGLSFEFLQKHQRSHSHF